LKKILFMPFLKLSSGHHQAADALMERFKGIDPELHCEKVDLLHYSYGKMEGVVSEFYLKWIHHFPKTYHWLYKNSVCDPSDPIKRFRMYELLFEKFMVRLIDERQPDLIVCTHALPSYLSNRLKQSGQISVPLMNVYTDFFINNIWGLHEINYHLAPDHPFKEWLLSKGVERERIFVTGIPVHPEITRSSFQPVSTHNEISVLMTGGSLGAGVMKSFILKAKPSSDRLHYKVLCGKNEELYNFLDNFNSPWVTPLPYIQSREQMNQIYNETDVILTKPGGVTISESLYKAKPIFVYHALPGQEEMNLKHLKHSGLAIHLQDWDRTISPLEQEMFKTLRSEKKMNTLQRNVTQYHNYIAENDLDDTLYKIYKTNHLNST
jgi:processive 1,2-diacylglycerol beta-glucosyltransferase